MKDISDNDIVRLYQSGMSENRIAKHFGVARCSIRLRLLRSGTHIRGQSEAEVLKWQQMSPEQRINQVKAFHDKIRGTSKTYVLLCKRALGVQAHFKPSKLESIFLQVFKDAKIEVVPWFAVGKFNIDFALPKSKIAIEINGGNFHDSPKKIKQDFAKVTFLNSLGWFVLYFYAEDLFHAVEIVKSAPSFIG